MMALWMVSGILHVAQNVVCLLNQRNYSWTEEDVLWGLREVVVLEKVDLVIWNVHDLLQRG